MSDALTELRSRRVGGANYQIPQEVSTDRRLVLALRWILNAAKERKGMAMHKKLAQEIIEASKNEGGGSHKKRKHAKNGRGKPRIRAFSVVNYQHTTPYNTT